MLLNLIEQSAYRLHHISELGASERTRYEHGYNPWEYLETNLFHAKCARHLLIYLKQQHAHLWVCLSCPYLLEALEYLIFHGLLIDIPYNFIEHLKRLPLNLYL